MKKLALILALLLTASPAVADEVYDYESTDYEADGVLRANLKRAGFELSSTDIRNAREYRDSPNSRLSGDSETMIKGGLDFVLEYEKPKYQWNNSVFMEYGETKLKPVDGPDVVNENSDKILLTSDYARKSWRVWEADVGPFANIGYQTEFQENDDAPLTKIFRGKTGIKMFNGKYIKEMYIAAVGEVDLTYSKEVSKSAYELGLKGEYPLRDGVKFELDTYFRDYLTYSSYNPNDFEYEFSLTSRMMVDIYKGIKFGPYIQYLQAIDRGSKDYGSSTIIGVAVSYDGVWDL